MDRKIHNVHEGNFIGKLATCNIIEIDTWMNIICPKR